MFKINFNFFVWQYYRQSKINQNWYSKLKQQAIKKTIRHPFALQIPDNSSPLKKP